MTTTLTTTIDIPVPEINEKVLKLTDDLTNGMLRDYVVELEQQKTKLLLNLKEYRQKYEQQKSDQSDIYFYLNKKLDENYETIAALEEQILTEQADRENQERALEKRIHTLELEAVAMEAKYLAKLNEAEEKLNKLKEFGENKDELDRNLRKLLDTLEAERRQFRALTEDMDRRAVQERDRIKKECARQFEEYKESLQADADQKLSLKTKRTQEINSMMKNELSYQSKQADHVLLYNQKVLERDRELRQQLELSQTTQNEMVNRLALYQRLIKQLNERVIAEESQSAETIRTLQRQVENKDNEIIQLTSQLSEIRGKLTNEYTFQNNVWSFLSSKYKKLAIKSPKELPNIEFPSDPDERVLHQLVAALIQKFPEKYPTISKSRQKSQDDSSLILPQINKRSIPSNDIDVVSSSTTTGIYTWDSARASPRQKWWNSTGNENIHFENNLMRSIGIQTDGYVLPYPPDSSWLKKSRENETQSTNHSIIETGNNLSNTQKTDDLQEEPSLKDIIEEIQISNSNLQSTSIPSGDPLTKKKQSHRILTKSQNNPTTTAIIGRGRLAKKVYVDPTLFVRDDDITDSYSSNDSYSYPNQFSVNGKSISNSNANANVNVTNVTVKPKSQPKKTYKRPNQDETDDNSIISNITISPR